MAKDTWRWLFKNTAQIRRKVFKKKVQVWIPVSPSVCFLVHRATVKCFVRLILGSFLGC